MLEVTTVLNMRNSDKAKIASGISGRTLMYQAALGVYNNVFWYGTVGIICGSGNNAGDGYALALILKEKHYDVTLVMTGNRFSEDGKYYYDLCQKAEINTVDFSQSLSFDIIVDALLGTGFKGDVNNYLAEIIHWINQSKAYVVSIDINSGLNGDNGLTSLAVISDLTISIGTYKVGHFANMAKDYIRKKLNVDIGIPLINQPFYLIEKADIKSFFLPRKNMSNKGDYGYIGIIGASENYPGAIRLANLGQNALYAGCGVAKLIVPKSLYALIFANVLETVVTPVTDYEGKMQFDESEIQKAIKGLKALAVGVGWDYSLEYVKILEYLLTNFTGPLVIDADGINTLARMDLELLNHSCAKVILTPHLKEFARLIGRSVQDIQANLIEYAQAFVNKYQVVLLLKGPMTIVCNKDNCYLIDTGTPGMATAGSGDVLTGILVGLLGQKNADITQTVAIGAYLNGYSGQMAADKYGEVGMVAQDTARMVSFAIKELIK